MTRFVVLHSQYARVAGWFQWFPPEEATLSDRVLAEKLYRSQWDPNRQPGQAGHSHRLDPKEATRLRLWYDYVADVVLDEVDDHYANQIDEYLTRYA